MMNQTQKFIEDNISLFYKRDWKALLEKAYYSYFTTAGMRELCDAVEQSFKCNLNDLRSDLLYEHLDATIKRVKVAYKNTPQDELPVHLVYAAQFLRINFNNTFGYLENEAITFMYENQKSLGINMLPMKNTYGQSGITNYKIFFN